MTSPKPQTRKIFGLTGGIGSGKSTVANAFKQLGIQVVDADLIARDVVAVGQPALAKIAEHFGNSILLSDGSLDRAQLRKIIFADHEQKKWLEQLLHPIIRTTIQYQLQQTTSPYVLLESPLLLETDQHQLVNKVIVVDIDEATQLKRASQRDGATEMQIQQIIATQLPRQQRRARADYIIDNSGDFNHIQTQIRTLHNSLMELSLR